jgi:hypothetical protein
MTNLNRVTAMLVTFQRLLGRWILAQQALRALLLHGLLVLLIRHQHTTKVSNTAITNLNQVAAMLVNFQRLLGL